PTVQWWLGPKSPLRINGVRAVESWMPEIRTAASEAALPDPFLLAGLVYAESRGHEDAVSSIGALGLCQVMPTTAEEVGKRRDIPYEGASPADNLRLGAWYLTEQIRRFSGDLDLALLAYRLGPNRVQRELDAAGSRAAYVAELEKRKPSPWGYREQVEELRKIFEERAR
ncbi:MAG: transglycosylase SLT domain-containing protein, partial [Planctomycetes bacterium]|nr:transglycosylase SLT domain-containing protein [Planctomycetota bacterium]